MTNINFANMTISELGEMAKYYSTNSTDSIERMVRMNCRASLESTIKYSSKFMKEERNGEFTFNSTATSTEESDTEVFDAEALINQTMADIRAQQAQAHAERIRNAEKFVNNICRSWAAAYGLEEEYDLRTK